jgi:hypothetical protein
MYNVSCSNSNLVWYCGENSGTQQSTTCIGNLRAYDVCQSRHIAVAPSTSSNIAAASEAQAFVLWANANTVSAVNYTTFVYFASESSFLQYAIGNPAYSIDSSLEIYSSAIIINSVYPTWDYVIRMNKTFNGYLNPRTSTADIDIKVKTNYQSPSYGGSTTGNKEPYLIAYNDNGHFALTDVLNSYILHSSCITASCATTPTINVYGIANFPNPPSLSSGFWSAIGFSFALVMIIALLYPLSNIIRALVQEKESKIREGMMMMSLRADVLWLSWIFHFLCLFVPLSIILTLIGTKVFEYSSGIYIWCYFITFFISSISYCVFMSVFFSKARTAAIIGTLVFFGGFFIYIGLETANPSRESLLAACLHPAAAFTFGTLAFIEYEDAQIGITSSTWNVSQTYAITFQDCLNMMLVDAIYLGVLAWYLSNIWPSEYGTHKKWYFVFDPYYWCGGFYTRFSVRTVTDDNNDKNPMIETIPESLLAQRSGGNCVDVKGLVKYYETNTGRKTAVDKLNLTMFSGQITALLGHNGAGKVRYINLVS